MAKYKPHNYDFGETETSKHWNGSPFTEDEDKDCPETEAERIRKEKTYCKIVIIFFCIVVILSLVSAFFQGEKNINNFKNNWTIVEGTEEKATVIASQIEQRTKNSRYNSRSYIVYLTIKTSNGKTGTFLSSEIYRTESQCKPIAGLNVGDSCTICIKRYSGETCQYHWLELEDGDTAYFINDEIAFYQSEEEMTDKFLKDF